MEFRSPWVLKNAKHRTNWFPRSAWDKPARTLTTQVGSNKAAPHCHPDCLRGLSVEECAAIQTFPPGFCLAGSRNQRYKQLGNAVPMKFAQAVAEHLKQHMARQGGVELGQRDGVRVGRRRKYFFHSGIRAKLEMRSRCKLRARGQRPERIRRDRQRQSAECRERVPRTVRCIDMAR
jgi:hypothetical protein